MLSTEVECRLSWHVKRSYGTKLEEVGRRSTRGPRIDWSGEGNVTAI